MYHPHVFHRIHTPGAHDGNRLGGEPLLDRGRDLPLGRVGHKDFACHVDHHDGVGRTVGRGAMVAVGIGSSVPVDLVRYCLPNVIAIVYEDMGSFRIDIIER